MRDKWEDNINIDAREIGCEGENWIELAQSRVQWWSFACMIMDP
jgi:hypothetical protein